MVTRRVMLQLAGSIGLGIGLPATARAADAPPHWMPPDSRQTLMVYFDTLVPDSGIGEEMDRRLAPLTGDAERRAMIDVCDWLDGESRKAGAGSFAAADEARRNIVLEQAFQLPPEEPMRRFFDRTRTFAFNTHYSKASNWTTLGYEGPPQPLGFPDHAQPPGQRSRTSS